MKEEHTLQAAGPPEVCHTTFEDPWVACLAGEPNPHWKVYKRISWGHGSREDSLTQNVLLRHLSLRRASSHRTHVRRCE